MRAGHTGVTKPIAPLEAVRADPPEVWFTYFDAFVPGTWGFVGFTHERWRTRFIRETRPGALVVAIGSVRATPAFRRAVMGLFQCSHETGPAERFMASEAWLEKQADARAARSWNHGVRAVRAWRVLPHSAMPVEALASETWSPARAQAIGSAGMRLRTVEARRILDLDIAEVPVFGMARPREVEPGRAEEVLARGVASGP